MSILVCRHDENRLEKLWSSQRRFTQRLLAREYFSGLNKLVGSSCIDNDLYLRDERFDSRP